MKIFKSYLLTASAVGLISFVLSCSSVTASKDNNIGDEIEKNKSTLIKFSQQEVEPLDQSSKNVNASPSLYTPAYFKEENTAILHRFVQDNSFAAFITHDQSNNLCVSHINLILEEKEGKVMLYGHLSRANSQAEHLTRNPKSLAIFMGPHTYISPSWYKEAKDVPTWNYTVVHAHGSIRIISDREELKESLNKLVSKFESKREKSWSVPWEEKQYASQLGGIVGFEMCVNRLEGKFKLSQNRSAVDRLNVISTLGSSDNNNDRVVSSFMRNRLISKF
jgi:transcriptional regulator